MAGTSTIATRRTPSRPASAYGDDVAAEDLKAGTELTTDYRTICDAMRLNGFDFELTEAAQSPSKPRVPSFA